jgi:hypothetical protein
MSEQKAVWLLDQLAKSAFFHQKLHEWQLLETAYTLEGIRGEELDWNLETLDISSSAWNKIIHRGIKPILVFAHPVVLTTVMRSTSYYRMLAMVSQKSMKRIGLDVDSFEQTDRIPNQEKALLIAKILNRLVSNLIEADREIDQREFDLWRGMAAGTQAQGSWQNDKGNRLETVIKGMLHHRLSEKNLFQANDEISTEARFSQHTLADGRILTFGDEPDVAFYHNEKIVAAVEVKGGIDTAGVLERVGAAIKSLSRAKRENPSSVTILLMPSVSMTAQAQNDLVANQNLVNHWFTVEEILDNEQKRTAFFDLLGI